MLCPNCKKEIPDGTQFCSECGASVNASVKKQKNPVTKKWWFWVIIVVVVIALFSAVSGGGDDADVSSDSGDSVVEQNDGETTTEADDGKYYVGDKITDNGVEITYVSAEKWTGYSQYSAPADGNMIVRIALEVVNNGTSDFGITMYDFNCYADNQAMSEYWNADDWISATVSSGRSASGYVYFEVPANAESIEIEYETNYWTDEKAVFVVEL
ncbi:MAG: DUF2116 family Zn-ribbon domain-containing protein [Clostridia bacterium]|nr:DUF2116 family Zn-ribbon domain-containing protein [Clostridia bacterium]